MARGFYFVQISGEFDDGWWVGELAFIVDHGAVHQGGSFPGGFAAVAAMDVSEDMQPWLDAP